ncbi:hypothetical protein JG688_00007170 [Phytophthora aleatoria]|uniref:Uncharacterized protein n=1 Tax=Phytophthora aleatoria TaxID=2496075 RepID=A0A8J5MGJ5_9STRA|nr:hypothetical protein JG688_00007170 [Phytophthora aleatoria]
MKFDLHTDRAKNLPKKYRGDEEVQEKNLKTVKAFQGDVRTNPKKGWRSLEDTGRIHTHVARFVENDAKGKRYHSLAAVFGPDSESERARFDIEPTSFIPQLLELINAPKTRTTYVASQIAQSTSTHFYTRPRTSRNSNLLKWHGASRIKSKRLSKYYKRVMRFEDKYRADIEECELIDDEKRCEVGDGEDDILVLRQDMLVRPQHIFDTTFWYADKYYDKTFSYDDNS